MFSLLVFFISAAQLLFAQTGAITGKVSDSNGSELPGVNVLVKERTMERQPISMEIIQFRHHKAMCWCFLLLDLPRERLRLLGQP